MSFTKEDLKELQTFAAELANTLDSMDNLIAQYRDFTACKKRLTEEQLQADYQAFIDRGLIPGAYFKKFDSEDIFQIKGIGSDCYTAVNISHPDDKVYRMPLRHYLTDELMTEKYTICEPPQKEQ